MFSYFVYVLYLTFFKQSPKAFLFQQPLLPLITVLTMFTSFTISTVKRGNKGQQLESNCGGQLFWYVSELHQEVWQ